MLCFVLFFKVKLVFNALHFLCWIFRYKTIEICLLKKSPTSTTRDLANNNRTRSSTTNSGKSQSNSNAEELQPLQKCLKCLEYAKITNYKVNIRIFIYIYMYTRYEIMTKTIQRNNKKICEERNLIWLKLNKEKTSIQDSLFSLFEYIFYFKLNYHHCFSFFFKFFQKGWKD